ncbi:MAG: hypothetical protein PHI64_02780 [Zoogloea sp.]|uniref:InlB B-repeat-containing protein n=1 Tax=Zoogloea sp. TaxID=49181 RepID=UPI002630910B|nr:hypothetical protein [Zoogloea sp.]MDD2987862.1 hypothetical protein [Zoogloea sp.]
MKKLFVTFAVCGLLPTASISATDFDISIDNGAVTRYVLQNLSVSASGAVTVSVTSTGAVPTDPTYPLTITQSVGGTISANNPPPYTCTGGVCPSVALTAAPITDYAFTSWGGACAGQTGATCTLQMSTARVVSATFTSTVAPPPSTACNPANTTVVDVATELPLKSFARTDYRPTPATVYSFAFKTTSASNVVAGQLSVAKLSSSLAGKLIVVSECRGDIDTALTSEKTGGCVRFGAETSTISYVVNALPPVKPSAYCNLKPNTQYYLNVVPRQTTDGAANCTSTTNCGFSFLAN